MFFKRLFHKYELEGTNNQLSNLFILLFDSQYPIPNDLFLDSVSIVSYTIFKYFLLYDFFPQIQLLHISCKKQFDTDILNLNRGLLKLRYPSECAAMLSLTNWKCIFLSRDIFALIYYCFLCGTYALLLYTGWALKN